MRPAPKPPTISERVRWVIALVLLAIAIAVVTAWFLTPPKVPTRVAPPEEPARTGRQR